MTIRWAIAAFSGIEISAVKRALEGRASCPSCSHSPPGQAVVASCVLKDGLATPSGQEGWGGRKLLNRCDGTSGVIGDRSLWDHKGTRDRQSILTFPRLTRRLEGTYNLNEFLCNCLIH